MEIGNASKDPPARREARLETGHQTGKYQIVFCCNMHTQVHGIMGRRFPDHIWMSNIVFPTTPGRLIQFLLGDWSAEILCDQ